MTYDENKWGDWASFVQRGRRQLFPDRADGIAFNFSIAQSNVTDKFTMLVPIYLELDDGRIISVGRVRMLGNTSFSQKVSLKGLQVKPGRHQLLGRRSLLAELIVSPCGYSRITRGVTILCVTRWPENASKRIFLC